MFSFGKIILDLCITNEGKIPFPRNIVFCKIILLNKNVQHIKLFHSIYTL